MNAVATNLVMTANLRALLDFYAKRRKDSGAQAEISELAEKLREEITKKAFREVFGLEDETKGA